MKKGIVLATAEPGAEVKVSLPIWEVKPLTHYTTKIAKLKICKPS
jgi:hypothetical protein